jgi:hypothetical protein
MLHQHGVIAGFQMAKPEVARVATSPFRQLNRIPCTGIFIARRIAAM